MKDRVRYIAIIKMVAILALIIGAIVFVYAVLTGKLGG